jgi:hypothetical protein
LTSLHGALNEIDQFTGPNTKAVHLGVFALGQKGGPYPPHRPYLHLRMPDLQNITVESREATTCVGSPTDPMHGFQEVIGPMDLTRAVDNPIAGGDSPAPEVTVPSEVIKSPFAHFTLHVPRNTRKPHPYALAGVDGSPWRNSRKTECSFQRSDAFFKSNC